MKNLKSNKAFQNILKNAPEMPAPQMPEDTPKSNGNGNVGLVISITLLLVSQFLMYMAINNSQKKILGQMNSFPQPPKTNDDSKSSIEKENPNS
jgi:hypothetical protein